jgi:hypothetical protein
MNGVACIGSRVRHYGQRYTPWATATVIGFRSDREIGRPWIKVLVKHDRPGGGYDFPDGWDWDRTQLAPDMNP